MDPNLPYALAVDMNPLAHPAVEGKPMLQFRIELDRSMGPSATTVGMLIALGANVALLPDVGHGVPCYKAITQIDWPDWLDRPHRQHATLVFTIHRGTYGGAATAAPPPIAATRAWKTLCSHFR